MEPTTRQRFSASASSLVACRLCGERPSRESQKRATGLVRRASGNMVVRLIGGVAFRMARPSASVSKSSSLTASGRALSMRGLTEANATSSADRLLTFGGGAHLPMERLQCLSVIRRVRVERLDRSAVRGSAAR